MDIDIEVLHLLTWRGYGPLDYWDYPKDLRDLFDLSILISLGRIYTKILGMEEK